MRRCGRAFALVVIAASAVVGWWPGGVRAAGAEDAAPVRFAESSLQVTEGRGQVPVLVERTDLPVSRLIVQYRTASVDGSAMPGADYIHASGSLVFEVGARSAVFTVWVRDDEISEGTEHLLLHLETSSGSGASARLTVLDDDSPPAPAPSASSGSGAARTVVTTPAAPMTAPPPVVVASSAGSSRPAVAVAGPRVRARPAGARPAPPRRIILEQRPTTPFELRPTPGSFGGDGAGVPTTVDPLLALAAGLLLARVGAEAWFRARILVAA